MDGEDPCIPALVPSQRPFFFLPHSFLFSFTQVYKPEQGLALPGFRRMFASVPVKARYHPPSCKIHQLLKQIHEKNVAVCRFFQLQRGGNNVLRE